MALAAHFLWADFMALATPDQLLRSQDLTTKSLLDIATGGPTAMATDPNREIKQLASLTEFLKRGAKLYGGAAANRATDAVPAADGAVGTPAIDARPRTASEGNLSPRDLGYKATQDAAAADVLTPDGVTKFKDQGRAETDLTPAGQAQAQLLEDAEAAAELTADQQLEAVVGDATKGLNNERQGFAVTEDSAGMASQEQADEILQGEALGAAYAKSIDAGAPFNFDNIQTTDDVKSIIQSVSDSLSEEEIAATRGRVGNLETTKSAQELLTDDLGLTRRVLKRQVGETFTNAAEATAARMLLADSAKKLADLARQVANGEGGDALMLAFRRQLAIHNGIQLQIKGMQTEAARLLQSFQIPVTDGMTDAAAAALRLDVIDASGGDGALRQAAQGLVAAAREGNGAFNQASQSGIIARGREGLEMLYINGLLSNPRTNLKNIFGNLLFMGYQLPEEVLAGFWGMAERGVRKAVGAQIDYRNQVYLADPLARMAGWGRSMGDAWSAASIAFRTMSPGDLRSKVDTNAYRNVGSPDTVFGRTLTHLYRAANIPTRFLLGGDEFFKVISQNGELHVQAYRQMQAARAAGMDTDAAVDEGLMVLLNPRGNQEGLDYKSQYDTLTSDLGKFGQAASALQNTLVGRYIMPFMTAPTNDVLRTMERNAALAFLKPDTYKNLFGKNAQKRSETLGRLTLAGSTGYLIAHYAAQGQITGGRPTDPKVREKLPTGWQPYSFVFRGEDFPVDADGDPLPVFDRYGRPNGPLQYVSYAGLGPVTSTIGITANALNFASYARSPKQRNDIIFAAVFAATDYFKELPFLQGMSNVVLSLQRQDPTYLFSGPLGSMNLVPGIPSPVSSLTRAGERLFDPRLTKVNTPFDVYTEEDIIRDTDAGILPLGIDDEYDFARVGLAKGDLGDQAYRAIVTGYGQMVATNILAETDDAEIEQYDTLGRRIDDGPSFEEAPLLRLYNSMSPFMLSYSNELSDVERELVELDWPIPYTPKTFKGVELTVKAQSYLVWYAKGEMIENADGDFVPKARPGGLPEDALPVVVKIDGRRQTFMEALERRMASKRYRKADDGRRRSMIDSLNKEFMEEAFLELTSLPEFANLATAADDIAELVEDGYR